MRNSTVGVSPLSPQPAEMREPAANTAQNTAFPPLHMVPGDGWSSLLSKRQTETPRVHDKEDENRQVNGYVSAVIALEEVRDNAFPVIVFGPTGAQMCKLTHELLRTLFPTDGKVISLT